MMMDDDTEPAQVQILPRKRDVFFSQTASQQDEAFQQFLKATRK